MLNVDSMLGCNPLNRCWITGVGHRPVEQVLHIDSWYDGIEAPIPGIVPYGPMRNLPPGDEGWTHKFGPQSAYPKSEHWPAEELWFGNYMSPSAAEFTVHETMGPVAAMLAYLHAVRQ